MKLQEICRRVVDLKEEKAGISCQIHDLKAEVNKRLKNKEPRVFEISDGGEREWIVAKSKFQAMMYEGESSGIFPEESEVRVLSKGDLEKLTFSTTRDRKITMFTQFKLAEKENKYREYPFILAISEY